MAGTIQQIAELAGVSRGTVDRALNNRGRINPEVAKQIWQIADARGQYRRTAPTHKIQNLSRFIQNLPACRNLSQRFLVVLYFFTDSITPSARPAMP